MIRESMPLQSWYKSGIVEPGVPWSYIFRAVYSDTLEGSVIYALNSGIYTAD